MANFSGSGHPIFRASSAFERGELRSKGHGKKSIHFNGSRRTRHVDTKVYFMEDWAMEPGQRILKVHDDS